MLSSFRVGICKKNSWKWTKNRGPMHRALVEGRTEEVLPTVAFERNWSSVSSHQTSVAEAWWRVPDHCFHAVPLITSWPVNTESSDPFRIFFFPSSARLHRLREAGAACLGIGARKNDDFDTVRGQCSCWYQRLHEQLASALSQNLTPCLYCNYKINCLSPVQRLQCIIYFFLFVLCIIVYWGEVQITAVIANFISHIRLHLHFDLSSNTFVSPILVWIHL